MSTPQTNPMLKLPSIKLKGGGKSLTLKNELQQQLIDLLKAKPGIMNLKLNHELTLQICNIIENKIKNNKKKKIDKKMLVTEVFRAVHNLTANDVIILGEQIDYMFRNGDIKKIPIRLLMQSILKFLGVFLFGI